MRQNIKPQLEETIQLRRVYAATSFHTERRTARQQEMIDRFREFRPQLNELTMETLFLPPDLLELSIVKHLVEETECRIPLTDERWLSVQDILFDAVAMHGRTIEADCEKMIRTARNEILEASRQLQLDKKDACAVDADQRNSKHRIPT